VIARRTSNGGFGRASIRFAFANTKAQFRQMSGKCRRERGLYYELLNAAGLDSSTNPSWSLAATSSTLLPGILAPKNQESTSDKSVPTASSLTFSVHASSAYELAAMRVLPEPRQELGGGCLLVGRAISHLDAQCS
jgi:hypothetical protein